MQDEILQIYKKLNKTIILVTHDIEEAIKLGSKIVVLKEGEIMTSGGRDETVFHNKNEFVNDFIGNKGFLSYLNLTEVKNYISPFDENYKQQEGQVHVNSEDKLIVGIRLCLENGLNSVLVRDENGNAVGQFELASLHSMKF
ncbi:MAG: hypothetical protein WBH44_00785 [Proteocatella sp.]